jgi:ABC-type multidrug transport system ATPase subunit
MITVAHVRKTFGSVVALDGVSLEVAAGESVAFVGTNGSGKTTLLRALLGLVRFEGRITIGGVDVAREPEVALRSVAYVPQIAPPIDAPVREVVRAHAAIRGMREDDTYARAAKLGLDLGASREKKFRELSGGMKQKLLAAMALATRAPVLVCDEPTANLDGEARAAFFAELAQRPPGAVLVLCSHRADEVRQLVGRVIKLEGGRIARDRRVDDDATAGDAATATVTRSTASELRPRLHVVRAP